MRQHLSANQGRKKVFQIDLKLIDYKELMELAVQVYAAFNELYDVWLSAVQSIAELDALPALPKGSMNIGGKVSRHLLVIISYMRSTRVKYLDIM
ncbi:uncharacterized protein ATC70_007385 [Mucor velutinosus]|uniref:Uncharacterized protein n=1 Tax=Mucor velutinosus TaxID=708070 RepID=A0AAN7D6U2_9FUNG|nr:hypothetical protein ATC70_007385 [Mucor velutinosus]